MVAGDEELKQKPFYKLKFTSLYKNNEKKPERMKVNKERKTKMYVTPEMFEKIKEIYKAQGSDTNSVSRVMNELNLSRGCAVKYLGSARKLLADRVDERNELEEVKKQLADALMELEVERRRYANNSERHTRETNSMSTRHKNEIDAYQTQLNQLTLEKTKLEAKVEVLSELVKGK